MVDDDIKELHNLINYISENASESDIKLVLIKLKELFKSF